jgi:hypothetical protein
MVANEKPGSDLDHEALATWMRLLRCPYAVQRTFWVAALCGAATPEGWTSEQQDRDRVFRLLCGRKMGSKQFRTMVGSLVERELARVEYDADSGRCTVWLVGPTPGWAISEDGRSRATFLVFKFLEEDLTCKAMARGYEGEIVRVFEADSGFRCGSGGSEGLSPDLLEKSPPQVAAHAAYHGVVASATDSTTNSEGPPEAEPIVTLQLRGGLRKDAEELGAKNSPNTPPGTTGDAADAGQETLDGFEVLQDNSAESQDKEAKEQSYNPDEVCEYKSLESLRKLGRSLVAFWGRRSGRPAVRVTIARLDMIRARLNEGYSTEDLFMAIAGITRSPWHRENGYDSFDLALRSSDRVEKAQILWHRHAPIARLVAHYAKRGEHPPLRSEEVEAYHARKDQAAYMQERLDRTRREQAAQAEAKRKQEKEEEQFTNALIRQYEQDKAKQEGK